jgi:hypothetical protein
MILFLFQAASHSSYHLSPKAIECNGNLYKENNIFEEKLYMHSADEDSKDNANMPEVLKPVDYSLKQSNNKGDSIISVETRKKVSISIGGTSNTEDFSTYNSNSQLDLRRQPYLGSSYSSQFDDGRRQSYFAEQKLDILIVDDSGLSRKMLSKLLCTTGCTFDEAEDGLIAVDKVKTKMSVFPNESEKDIFDVILMDYVMPNMDGPTATKAIRDLGYTAPIFGKYCIKYVYMHY